MMERNKYKFYLIVKEIAIKYKFLYKKLSFWVCTKFLQN